MYGVAGVGGIVPALPLIRESHFFEEGVIAILASESFCEMLRNRLCGPDFMIGDAAEVVLFSYGSELRNECCSGDSGVSGGNGVL